MSGIGTDKPGITICFRLPQGLSVFYRFAVESHTKVNNVAMQLDFEIIFYTSRISMNMPLPWKIWTNHFLLMSAVPRKEVPIMGTISETGITDATLLYVEESDHGVGLDEVK